LIVAWFKVWSQVWGWTCTISEHVLCKCAAVSGTELHLLLIAMYCWKLKSEIDRSYTGTQILFTSAIAALN
jgi:hypothetical protein